MSPVSQSPNDQGAYMTYQPDTENYGKSTADYHVLYDLKLLRIASFLSCSSLCVMFGQPEKSGILWAWISWLVAGYRTVQRSWFITTPCRLQITGTNKDSFPTNVATVRNIRGARGNSNEVRFRPQFPLPYHLPPNDKRSQMQLSLIGPSHFMICM